MNKFMKYLKSHIFKLMTLLITIIFVTISMFYYISSTYNKLKNDFFVEFNNCNFDEAKKIINDNSLLLKFNKKNLNEDLNHYFTDVVNLLCTNLISGNITSEKALVVFKEIQSYNILNSSIDKLVIYLDNNFLPKDSSDYKALLELGLDNCNNKNYDKAIKLLNMIPSTEDKYYSTAQNYIEQCKENYKEDLFASADSLVKEDYYTKAIELLSNINTNIVESDDSDIVSKINFIENAREDFLALSSEQDDNNIKETSSNILESINMNNINTLNISSNTSYLVYVDLNNQTTNVYTGYTDNWNLVQSFSCSTGIEGKETPVGIFEVTNKGDWFYADEYQQGGKYWVQFLGDYLFHSLPYDENQSTILDYTLGTPASHGCIRLNTEDAKWLYDNVDLDSKVIIN